MVNIVGGILIGVFITVLLLIIFSPAVILFLLLSPVGFWQIFTVLLLGFIFGIALLVLFIKVLSAISRSNKKVSGNITKIVQDVEI